MCAVYVMSKVHNRTQPVLCCDVCVCAFISVCVCCLVQVLKLSVTFQEIMRQYRHQPQAKSHVSPSPRTPRPWCLVYMKMKCTLCSLTAVGGGSIHPLPSPSLPSPPPPPPLLQVYRSVLLNNGRRTPPTPDSPSDEGEKVQSPPATRTTAKSPSLVEAEHSKKSPSPGEAEPVVKQELSGMGRMTEGERGDIIHFYNKVHF